MKSLIVGLGNIGLRHIQGLSKLNEKKNDFYIFDNSIDYLSRFKNEIDDLKNKNNLIFTKNLEKIKNINFDLTIISTNADARVKLLQIILDKINTEFILLEKPICNSLEDLNILQKISSKKIFINFPRRYCEWHLKIGKKIKRDYSNEILNVLLTKKDLGIACNISHYVDLINMWTDCYPVSVNNSNLNDWKNSKRKGFYEIDGRIQVFFQNNHKLELESDIKHNGLKINIFNQLSKKICLIDYNKGIAKFTDGEIIYGKMKYQSETTAELYKILINKRQNCISDLNLAVRCYDKILNSFIEHWNEKNNSEYKQIMIT